MKITRLETLRKERGLSRKELADAIDINESTLFRMEQRQHIAEMGTLIKLADVLNCDIAYLLNESDEVRKVKNRKK